MKEVALFIKALALFLLNCDICIYLQLFISTRHRVATRGVPPTDITPFIKPFQFMHSDNFAKSSN